MAMVQPFTARVDPRPVRPPTLSLLTSAYVRVDGSNQGPDREQGPTDDPLGPPDNQGGDSPIKRDVNADVTTDADYVTNNDGSRVRWVAGFSYRPEACNDGAILDPWGHTEPAAQAIENQVNVTPFVVEGTDVISTFGAITDQVRQERRDYAYRQLMACRSQVIEHELWNGTQSVASGWGNRYLSDSHVTLPEGDRLLGYVTSMAVLEQAISDGTCSQQGMIHCRADTATMWVTEKLVRSVSVRGGQMLVTELGTIVVPGGGYTGRAPLLGAAGMTNAHAGRTPSTDSAWAYATTIPEVFLSDLLPDQHIIERVAAGSNDLTTRCRQVAAVTWGCLQVGVYVDHQTRLSVTGS